jgi:hypothetical protein
MRDQLVPGRSIGGFGMFLPGIRFEVPEIGSGGGVAVAEPPAAPTAPADGQPGAASDAAPGEAADDLASQPGEPPAALGLPDDPAFREFLAEEVNTILGAQLSRILPPEGYGPAAAPAGQPSVPGRDSTGRSSTRTPTTTAPSSGRASPPPSSRRSRRSWTRSSSESRQPRTPRARRLARRTRSG